MRTWISSITALLLVTSAAAATGAAQRAGAGTVLADFPGTPCAAVLQRDGKIVVAGTTRKAFGLTRYLPSGRIDGTFGSGGSVRTSFGPKRPAGACAVVVAAGGGIAVAGTVAQLAHPVGNDPRVGPIYPTDYALARYRPDGRLDPSFGSHGIVVTDVKRFDVANDLALQPDGKIVAAGMSGGVVRYSSAGRLDPTFGSGGKAVAPAGVQVHRIAVQDNAIVLAGGASLGGTGVFGVTRLTARGSLDRGFGNAGIARTGVGPRNDDESTIFDVALAKDGSIVAVGYGEPGTTFGVVRYGRDGRLDPTFGSGGKVVTPLGPISAMADAQAVAIQPNGKLLVGGSYEDASGPNRFGLVRYNGDGRLDRAFGKNGIVMTSFAPGDATYTALLVGGAAGGGILLVGTVGNKVAFARYGPDGRPDATFGR